MNNLLWWAQFSIGFSIGTFIVIALILIRNWFFNSSVEDGMPDLRCILGKHRWSKPSKNYPDHDQFCLRVNCNAWREIEQPRGKDASKHYQL